MRFWYKFINIVLLIFLLVSASGCKPLIDKNQAYHDQNQIEIISSQKPGDKVSYPLKPEIQCKKSDLSDKSNMSVSILLQPFSDVTNVKVDINTTGAIKLSGQTEFDYKEILHYHKENFSVRIYSDKNGPGELAVTVSQYYKQGTLYGAVTVYLYFYISENELLVSYNGPMELELEHLKHLRQQGKISWEEYKKEYKRIMNGGAKIDIDVH